MSTTSKSTNVVALASMLALTILATQTAHAQTFDLLLSFDGTDGAQPWGGLVQATDGNFYGVSSDGGANGYGTVFKITPSGTLTTLQSFDNTDGASLYEGSAGLIQATNGDFYGTTNIGGAYGSGTVYKITAGGELTTLYSFCAHSGCPDGATPDANPIEAGSGDFYGTTTAGGAYGSGAIYKITASGTLTTLYSFCATTNAAGYCTDGDDPIAGLIQAPNGDFYGTTYEGGADGNGTVFKITASGTLTTLHSFNGKDGESPISGLIQAANGDLYGTTSGGGTCAGDGTIFKITTSGTLTTVHCFVYADNGGYYPWGGLVEGTDGNFYGTTFEGGANNYGAIYKVTPSGTLTTLYNFCSLSLCADGEFPTATLIQGTNGEFFGTTAGAGLPSDGSVFSLSVGLGPFVETQTSFGKVGSAVVILGSDLTGASIVTFDRTSATFVVNSTGTAITTSVPAGAKTGTVAVTTPGGVLSSNKPFTVVQK